MSSNFTWGEILKVLDTKADLSTPQVHWAMGQILQGGASVDEIKAYLTKLGDKGGVCFRNLSDDRSDV